MPAHNHGWPVIATPNTAGGEKGGGLNAPLANGPVSYVAGAPNTTLEPTTIGVAGSGLPHGNMMPFLTVNFIIALNGVFPSRS
jgi:microcystin-dependent protein